MSASTTATATEDNNVLFAERRPVCMFVPGTNNKEWTYGVTVACVLGESTMGSVILEHGNIRTHSKRDLIGGYKRMLDKSCEVGKPWFPSNVYCIQYKERRMCHTLDDLFDAFKAQPAAENQVLLQDSEGLYKEGLAAKKWPEPRLA
jgi:hypothetical protein